VWSEFSPLGAFLLSLIIWFCLSTTSSSSPLTSSHILRAMSQQRKYILKNNVLTLNPDFETSRHASGNSKQKTSSSAVAAPVVPLAIISSQNDLFMIQNIQTENGIIIEEDLPSSTVETIRYMQTTEYNTYFSVPSDRNLFDELCTYFIRYEVPIGLLTKLLVLRNYRLNFMVDDSGSMSSETDV
jgi:hypothetical protein